MILQDDIDPLTDALLWIDAYPHPHAFAEKEIL